MKATAAVLVLASAMGSMALPAPKSDVSEVISSGTISVPAEYNVNFKPNGPAALRKAYLKYHIPLPPALANIGYKKRQNSQEPATPASQDVEYICKVAIGTPAQTLRLDFDTGSADLYV